MDDAWPRRTWTSTNGVDWQFSHHLETLMRSLLHDGRHKEARVIKAKCETLKFDQKVLWFRLHLGEHDWEAAEASTVLLIPRDAFVSGLRLNPELALAVGADLVGRLERSKQLANGLALAGVQERVVSRLLAIGRQDGTPGPEGLLIRNRPTQQELANQIGACRETVSRTVSDLVRRGLLTPRGRSLLVSKQLVETAA